MTDQTLLPDPPSWHLLQIETEGNVITLVVRTGATEAPCPLCNSSSRSEEIDDEVQLFFAARTFYTG